MSLTRHLLASLALLLLVGCGGGGLEKVRVEGAVTFDGKPIENGDILFNPVDGTEGPISGGPIVDGRYAVTNKGGVPVGTHEVRIRGYLVDEAARQALAADPDAMVGRIQYVPEQYNEQTTLRITIDSGSGTVEKDFDLSK